MGEAVKAEGDDPEDDENELRCGKRKIAEFGGVVQQNGLAEKNQNRTDCDVATDDEETGQGGRVEPGRTAPENPAGGTAKNVTPEPADKLSSIRRLGAGPGPSSGDLGATGDGYRAAVLARPIPGRRGGGINAAQRPKTSR